MSDRNRQSRLVRQFTQQFFPHPNSTTVAPARIGQDQKAFGVRIFFLADHLPPTTYRINGEPRRTERRTHFNKSFVPRHVINSIRNRLECRLVREVVRFNVLLFSRGFPFLSVIGEIANKFLVFRIGTDHRPSGVLESRDVTANQFELSITVGMRRTGKSLDVTAKRKFPLSQPFPNRCRRDTSGLTSDLAHTQSDEFSFAGRGTSGLLGDVFFERLDDFGTFFSSGLRPPPGRRWRSTGRSSSPFSTSAFPRETQSRSSPTTSATQLTPPCPTSKASNPATCRFSCSFNRPNTVRKCLRFCSSRSLGDLFSRIVRPPSRNCDANNITT